MYQYFEKMQYFIKSNVAIFPKYHLIYEVIFSKKFASYMSNFFLIAITPHILGSENTSVFSYPVLRVKKEQMKIGRARSAERMAAALKALNEKMIREDLGFSSEDSA